MAAPAFRAYTLEPRGGPGLACDEDGLALGPLALARKIHDASGAEQYQLLRLDEMEEVLRLAYGSVPEAVIERRCRGIARVTELLASGADALARIHAVQLGFPAIAPDIMAKLAAAASLRKYNPGWEDEPRVPAGSPGGGQWTNGGDGGSSTGVSHDIAMSPECAEEWAAARLRCREYSLSGQLGRHSGFGRTYEQCVRGQVSAACGGNPVG